MEFLIRRTDGDWFDLHRDKFSETLRPTSFHSHQVEGWGDQRIAIDGIEISFSYEDPGIQINFDGTMDEVVAAKIVAEIADNITRVTGQGSRVVRL